MTRPSYFRGGSQAKCVIAQRSLHADSTPEIKDNKLFLHLKLSCERIETRCLSVAGLVERSTKTTSKKVNLINVSLRIIFEQKVF